MFKVGPIVEKTADVDDNILFDVLIIGAGSSGFTAAIYAARDGWKTLIVDKSHCGGLTATTQFMENYPGFPEGIDGASLMEKFEAQAKRFGAQILENEEVVRIQKQTDETFIALTASGKSLKTKSILLATGSTPRHLSVPGEREFLNKGVAYCATCDGPMYKDKSIVVVGAGNSGLQESQHLLHFVKDITVIEFLPYSIAEKVLQERVLGNERVKVLYNHQVTAIRGEKHANAVLVKDRSNGVEREIPTEGVFIYIGYRPSTDFIKGLVELDHLGYIITNTKMQTSVDGIYACGDVRANNPAQAAIAVGDGARASLAIREYLLNRNK